MCVRVHACARVSPRATRHSRSEHMVSAKKARGRLQRAQRTARPNAKPERYAPSRLTDDMHRHYEPDFVPIRITKELRGYAGAQIMFKGLEDGVLELWELGRKGTHIASRFVTTDGVEDTLMSPDPEDEDYAPLIDAHISRLADLIGVVKQESDPSA